jgi:putative transposase
MARRPRIEYSGALYHVITRGNHRQKIFYDDHDRAKYLEVAAQLSEAQSFRVHAYVLMANHVHLLLETGTVPLSRVMQRLGGGYTQYFNRRHRLTGHLFQGRYKAILCDKDNYLMELSRYLHLNPVRAKLVKDPADYPWSSYGAYARGADRQKWMETTEVLEQFGRSVGEARKLYRRFVMEGLSEGHKEEYYDVLDGRFLGDPEFAERIKARVHSPGPVRAKVKPEVFLRLACGVVGRERSQVIGAGKERERVRVREAISYVGRHHTELTVLQLADSLGVDPTCVSRSVGRVERRLAADRGLKKLVADISAAVENSKYQG